MKTISIDLHDEHWLALIKRAQAADVSPEAKASALLSLALGMTADVDSLTMMILSGSLPIAQKKPATSDKEGTPRTRMIGTGTYFEAPARASDHEKRGQCDCSPKPSKMGGDYLVHTLSCPYGYEKGCTCGAIIGTTHHNCALSVDVKGRR